MADINKSDIKLLQSQRLDDTPEGGGQMTSFEVIDGAVNNLFPDISRLDRVYGRVSMRKAFLAVQTKNRETYYGSHTIITEQAADPAVSMCFFSNKDWFDTRDAAKKRMESYLVQGPLAQLRLWGDHYKGTSLISAYTLTSLPAPEIGDVLVLQNLAKTEEQFLRVIDASSEITEFKNSEETTYFRKTITIKIGSLLLFDFDGVEMMTGWTITDDPTQLFATAVADASKYYGVSKLKDPAVQGTFQIRVDDIQTHLVPSAASQTAVTDAGVGTVSLPMVQRATTPITVTRSLTYNITDNSKLHIGEGVMPGTFNWSGGLTPLTDDGAGNIYYGANTVVGSITYATGIVMFNDEVPGNLSGTGTATYEPACAPTQVSDTGGIIIDINNRGFVYVYNCNPLPKAGTLKVEYLAGGKWYTMWDHGNGKIKGLDDSLGTGTLNYTTGSISLTLGAMPDVDSKVVFFWAKNAEYYNTPLDYKIPLSYNFTTNESGVARNTFVLTYYGDRGGTGPGGEYAIVDDGNGTLVNGEYDWGTTDDWVPSYFYLFGMFARPLIRNGYMYRCIIEGLTGGFEPPWPLFPGGTINDGDSVWECIVPSIIDSWEPPPSPKNVGYIRYASGEVNFNIDSAIDSSQDIPSAHEMFTLTYNYGPPVVEEFFAPPRVTDTINMTLTNTPIVPGTFKIEWHNNIEEYDPETRIDMTRDPTYIFRDDSQGTFDNGTGTVDYVTGEVLVKPDRTGSFPVAVYNWKITEWLHPGVEESYVFDHIKYYPAMSYFPTEGTMICSYCTTDGSNFSSYTGTLEPIYEIDNTTGLEAVPGSVAMRSGDIYFFDGGDGKMYTQFDGVNGDRTEVGTVNYTSKSVTISSDDINLNAINILYYTGTASIDPKMSIIFRTPGAPINPGSFYVRGTRSDGVLIEGTSDFTGDVTGAGIVGHIDYNTGMCHVAYGTWVPDDATAQEAQWYSATANDGAGNVWKPYSISAATIRINCVINSYLPLDPELLGLDPVRLPMDGKVPVFRDGYIIVIHNTREENVLPQPLEAVNPITNDILFNITNRTNVDLIEVYSHPTPKQLEDGTQTCAIMVPELRLEDILWVPNYEVDLENSTVLFKAGFTYPVDGEGTPNQLTALHRIEDMLLASDVQVTGHIDVTSAITHDYPEDETLVSSVLPSADLQSRAYNEFEQGSWTGEWSDYIIGTPPLASYNFVDYPIDVTNTPSIKERWLLLWQTTSTLKIVGENFGVLAENVSTVVGNIEYLGENYVGVINKNFENDPNIDKRFYFLLHVDGFGLGWQAGNCLRFNQDAANFPHWFIRTTLQAPPTEAVDHYTIQIRGDSS